VTTSALTVPRFAPFWRDHGPFLGVILGSTLTVMALDLTGLVPGMAAPFWDWPSAALLLPFIPALALGAVIRRRLRDRIPYRVAWADARQAELATDRLLSLALVIVAVRFLMLNAVAWKASIPVIRPFYLDAPLARLDAILHGGDAWTRLPMHPLWLRVLDAFYLNWFLAFFAVILWWGWQAPSGIRRRRLVAVALVWVVGSMLGVMASSAGPVYYEAVTGDARYRDLLAALHGVPLAATALQSQLWAAYAGADTGVIKGIAAFPSLHVAVPALVAVASRGRMRWLWWSMTALTLVGSVSLGWHYAFDGYAGILLAWGCWKVAQ
jgi:hypothetical protein